MSTLDVVSRPGRTGLPFRGRAAVVVLAALVAAPALFSVTTDIAAVYSATGNGYARVKLADGSYKAETYTFAEGGRWDGKIADSSIDRLSFVRIAQTIAGPLRQQNYVMSADPKAIDLMIMVFWGTTTGAEHPEYHQSQAQVANALSSVHAFNEAKGFAERIVQNGQQAAPYPTGDVQGMMNQAAIDELGASLMLNQSENVLRDRNNSRNAVILGFWDDYNKASELPTFAFANTIIEELEADRYFVVLKAYDFQSLRQQKVKRLLWETRFSVRERNNRFDEILPIMAQRASKYFGQNSRHLLREVVPVGRVDVGTPTVVEPERK